LNERHRAGTADPATRVLRRWAAVLLLASSCASAGGKPADFGLPPEWSQILRGYESAWQAKDAGALAALFTQDGFVLSDGRAVVRGREAIRAAYASAGGPLWLRALDFRADGDVGYIVGVYGHDPKAAETGKFVLALRREASGRWLIAADIDNSIRPSPAAPASVR